MAQYQSKRIRKKYFQEYNFTYLHLLKIQFPFFLFSWNRWKIGARISSENLVKNDTEGDFQIEGSV